MSTSTQPPTGRIVRNVLALGLARPLTWASAIGLTILLPRFLGDVNLGKVNFAFAFADWCGLLVSFGIGTYLTKEVAKRNGAGSLVLNALVFRVAVALLVGIGAAAVATVLDFDETTRHLIYLLTAHMLLMVINGVLVGGLSGLQQMKTVAFADAVSKTLLLGLVAVFLWLGYGVYGVAWAYILSDLLSIAWQAIALRRGGALEGRVSLSEWRSLVVGGAPFLIWETALLTYARVDVLILALFAHDAVLGWYHAAYKLIGIPLFIPVVIMTAIFPAMSAAAKDRVTFNAITRRAYHIAALTTIPMSFGMIVLADQLIDLLGYPEAFHNSVVPMMAMAVGLPLVALNMIVGSALNAQDIQRKWAMTGVAAAVLNVSLNFIAIPYTQATYGNGAIGAAVVTTITEVFMFSVGQYLLPRDVLDRATFIGVFKCVGVGLAMAAVVWLARGLPPLVTIPLGAIVYGAGSLALGTVSVRDLARVRTYIAARRAPAAAAA